MNLIYDIFWAFSTVPPQLQPLLGVASARKLPHTEKAHHGKPWWASVGSGGAAMMASNQLAFTAFPDTWLSPQQALLVFSGGEGG